MLFDQNANSGEVDETQEGIIRLVIAGSNTAKPFGFLKEALHQMPFLIEPPIAVALNNPVGLGGNHGNGALLPDIPQNGVSVIRPVPQDIATRNIHFAQNFNGVCGIMVIPGREQELDRIA